MVSLRVASDSWGSTTQGGHHAPTYTARALCLRRHSCRPRRAGRRPGGRAERLERDRPEPRDHTPADGARTDSRDRDGAGRGLRRCQRDRPRPQAVPAERPGPRSAAVGLGGRGHRHGGPPRAGQARGARPGGGARHGVPGNTRRRFRTGWSSSKAFAPARPPRPRCSPPARTTGTSRPSTSAS